MRLLCSPGLEARALEWSAGFGFDFAGVADTVFPAAEDYVLFLDSQGLALRQTGKRAAGPIRCDFTEGSARHRRLYGGGKSQAIARAIGIRDGIRPAVADLTAGMGGDAFVLATLGCRVTMVERHPVVAALVEDGLGRARLAAREDDALAAILARLDLRRGDAECCLRGMADSERPDVIYLDPMFPERKKSALVNKTMQAFQQLVGDDTDADQLLPLALARARHRVVVKRPAQAPWLDGQQPGYEIKGKAVRFDIYPLKTMAPAAR